MAEKEQLNHIVNPHCHDVLSGRGNVTNRHPGNEHFRSLVKNYKSDYVACPKSSKPLYSKLIYDEIRSMNPPGRFLKQDPVTKLWSDIGQKAALAKTRQALREGAPELLMDLRTAEHVRQTLAQDYAAPVTNNSSVVSTNASENQVAKATGSLSNYLPRNNSSNSVGSDSLLSLGSGNNANFQFSQPSMPAPAQVNGFSGVPPSMASSSVSSIPGEGMGRIQVDQFGNQFQMPPSQPISSQWQPMIQNCLQPNSVPTLLQFPSNFNQSSSQGNQQYSAQIVPRVSVNSIGGNNVENAPLVTKGLQNSNANSNSLMALLANMNATAANSTATNPNNTVTNPNMMGNSNGNNAACTTSSHSSLLQQLQSQLAYQQLLSQLGLPPNGTSDIGYSNKDTFIHQGRAKSA